MLTIYGCLNPQIWNHGYRGPTMGLEPWILVSMASPRTNPPFSPTHIQILRDEISPQSLRGMVIPILVYNTRNLFLLRISFWYVSFNAMVKIRILITFRLANFFSVLISYYSLANSSLLFVFYQGKTGIVIESLFGLYMRVSGQLFVVIRFWSQIVFQFSVLLLF